MKNNLTLLLLLSFFQLKSQIPFFEIFHTYSNLGYISEIAHGDFNGDNIPDFVISSPSSKKLYVGINDQLLKPTFINIQSGFDIRKIAVHDMDQDGDQDIIGSLIFNDLTYCWQNDGSGNFTALILPLLDYKAIHFADMDGDTIDDMLMGTDGKFNIYSITNGVITLLKTITNDVFNVPDAIDAVDYNNDGLMDVAGTYGFSGVKVFQQSGNLNFTTISITPTTDNNVQLVADDINNDSITDFLLYSGYNTATTLLKSQAAGGYIKTILPEPNGQNKFSAFGDINDDGITDILYTEEQSSVTGTITMNINENGEFVSQTVNNDYADLGGGAIADLDGDGDQDIYIFANDFFNPGLVYFINQTPVDADNDGFAADVDCDDENPAINSGQTEILYNALDDDCNPATLDDDIDQDGFLLADDCNDNNASINSAQTEILYNALDDDCNPATSDDDIDQDGFLLADDCNDNNASVNPAQTEILYNALDDDCNPATLDDDIDQDGFAFTVDCDDNNASINPNANDIPNNGIDEDCNGMDLTSASSEPQNFSTSIYPNPATNQLNIITPEQLYIAVSLFSPAGKLIFNGLNSNKIYLNNLPSGIYLLVLTDLISNQKVIEKISIMPK
jgi:Secretion system C-terminal sorting domain/FG-GAP-like repeat/Putative metal-binding motif